MWGKGKLMESLNEASLLQNEIDLKKINKKLQEVSLPSGLKYFLNLLCFKDTRCTPN